MKEIRTCPTCKWHKKSDPETQQMANAAYMCVRFPQWIRVYSTVSDHYCGEYKVKPGEENIGTV